MSACCNATAIPTRSDVITDSLLAFSHCPCAKWNHNSTFFVWGGNNTV